MNKCVRFWTRIYGIGMILAGIVAYRVFAGKEFPRPKSTFQSIMLFAGICLPIGLLAYVIADWQCKPKKRD